MPRAEHRRRSSVIGDARRPERAKPQAERMRRPELWAGRPSLLRRSGVRASQVAPLRTTFAAFLHGATYGLVGLSACRNAASRNTPQVGAPFMTPVAQKGETTGGTGATTGVLGREAVFVMPFRRRASQVAPLRTTFAAFLHGATYGLVGLSACRNAASRNTPLVGAPFMTPAVRQDETTNGTGEAARGCDCLPGTSVGTIGKTARATGSS